MSFADQRRSGLPTDALAGATKERGVLQISELIELSVVERVLREVMPAKAFEPARKTIEDWYARGRPSKTIYDHLIEMVVHGVDQLERLRQARIARRELHILGTGKRQEMEAAKLGSRLRLNDWKFACSAGPDLEKEERGADSSPVVAPLSDSPAGLVAQLQATAAGCRWLHARWDEIRERLEPDGDWYAEAAFKMIRLMGKTPRDVLEDSEVVEVFLAGHALDRRGRNPFNVLRGKLSLLEANDLVRRLGPRVKPTREDGDALEGRQVLIAMVDRATALLVAKEKEHEERARSEEARKAAEREFDASPEGLRLERYEQDCQRSLKESASAFRRLGF
jgi:hypothetical protein